MPRRPFKLLSIAHSYVVALNRRLAHEMSRAGAGEWAVAAVAPTFVHGDLRPLALEAGDPSGFRLEGVNARFTKYIHVMHYGRRLKQILAEPWDAIHAWEEPYILVGGQIARWTQPEAKLVYSTFQNISKRYPPPFSWIERYCMRKAAGWIAFGETIRQALADRPGYADKPMRVLPLGVDLDVFHPSPERGAAVRRTLGLAESGPPVVGYLGRFVPEKGLALLMRSLEQLSSPWRAMFVGAGPLEAELRAWAARRPDQVRIVTGVPHDRVAEHLNAMDLLCAPSQTTANWREQLGRMLLEAFASGIPVVASDSGEIPFVVDQAGVIVAEADEPAWVRTLDDLLASPARRQELAERGLDRARSVYAWPVVARGHLQFFEELIAGAASAGVPIAPGRGALS